MVRRAVVVLIVLQCFIGLASSALAQPVEIRIAHRWAADSHFHWGLENAVKTFESDYPNIDVEIQYGYTDDKYKLEIAAGSPPHIIFVAPPGLISWGLENLLQPLNRFIERSDVSPDDFLPAAWPQLKWEDEVYAMPLQVDPNFALIWNKDLFAEVGLNADQSPRTVAEYEEYFEKLTRYGPDNTLETIGMIPWGIYGYPNTIFTWGGIYGGSFFDYESNRVTADDPPIVDALTYLRDAYERYSAEVTELGQGLPSGRNLFSGGRQAMHLSVTGELFEYVKRFPDLNIGIGKMFYNPESGVENPAWLGGWAIGMPPGIDHEQEAWRLMKFLTADPEGTALFAEASGWMPFYVESPIYETFAQDPYMKVYMEIAMTAQNFRPAMPVVGFYFDQQLNQAVTQVFNGEQQPLQALQQVSERTQIELENFLAGK